MGKCRELTWWKIARSQCPNTTVNRAWGFHSSNRHVTDHCTLVAGRGGYCEANGNTPLIFSAFSCPLNTLCKFFTCALESVWIVTKIKTSILWSAALQCTGPRALKLLLVFCSSIWVILSWMGDGTLRTWLPCGLSRKCYKVFGMLYRELVSTSLDLSALMYIYT